MLISVPDLDKDLLFKYHKENICPTGKDNSKAASKDLIEDALLKGKDIMQKFAHELKVKLKLSKDVDFKLMKIVGDSAHSDFFHQPESSLLDMTQQLGNYVSNINAINHLAVYLDKRFIKVVISNLMKEILKFMEDRIKDPIKHKRKFVFYSTHDTNLSPLIMYLGIVDFNCNLKQIQTHEVIGCAHKPPYASSVIFELAKNENNEHAIFFRYNGIYRDICSGKFPPPVDKVPCTLEKLAERLKDATMEEETELHEFCGVEKPSFFKPESKTASKETKIDQTFGETKDDARKKNQNGLFSNYDTALLLFAVIVLSALVYKYKSKSDEHLRMLRQIAKENLKK